jgi:hypothetical protein
MVKLLTGLIQVGLLGDENLHQSIELVESWRGMFEDVIYRHITIQLVGSAFLAGRLDVPEEMWPDWLDLVAGGWFTTPYFMALTILCFKKITEGGGHPDVELVFQGLISGAWPDYPSDESGRLFLRGIPTMPVETEGSDWLRARSGPDSGGRMIIDLED